MNGKDRREMGKDDKEKRRCRDSDLVSSVIAWETSK